MLDFQPLTKKLPSTKGWIPSSSSSMSEWSHTYKHEINQDHANVLNYLHDSKALLGSSKEVTSLTKVDREESDGDADECWVVVERVKGLSIMEASTRVKIKKTSDGVNIHRKNSKGVELWSVWTVPGPSSNSSEKAIVTEYVMAKAPWYIMPIVKNRLSQTFTNETLQQKLESYS